jgi:dTMP kinase
LNPVNTMEAKIGAAGSRLLKKDLEGTMKKGVFISFEGIDGSGKSTQLQLCADALAQAGHSVVVTRNPGGTPFGTELRRILLHGDYAVGSLSELLLFMADRAQHREELILPALAAGKIVLCDRYHDSTLAYQGYGRGLNLAMIRQLNAIATQGLMPELTFLFDGDPAILAQRVNKRGQVDRLEGEPLSFRERVREGYYALAKEEPERIRILDATQSIDALWAEVLGYVQQQTSSRLA